MATSKSFGNLIKHVKSLPEIEQTKLFHLLRSKLKTLSATSGKMVQEMREKRFRDGTFCPHCNHDQVVRFGKTDNKQRYRCKGCKKTFNDFTKSVFAKTHKNEEWVTFFDCMLKGFSLRRSAEICDVHFVTLFYWRHKILHALQQIEIPSFEGIVEADETHFLESQKGKKGISARPARKRGGKSKYRGVSHEQVCVLVARDRSKTTLSKVVGFGHVNANQLDKTLSPKMSNENVLVSDAWRAYQNLPNQKDWNTFESNRLM